MAGGDDGPEPVPANAAPSGNLLAMFGILPVTIDAPPAPKLFVIVDHALPSITSHPAGGRTAESALYHITTVPNGNTLPSSLSEVTAPLTIAAVSTELSCNSPGPTELSANRDCGILSGAMCVVGTT